MSPPVDEAGDAGDEPEDGVDEDDPQGVLHPLYIAVAFGVLVEVHLYSMRQWSGMAMLRECHSEDRSARVPGINIRSQRDRTAPSTE